MSAATITLFLDFEGVLSNDAFSRHQAQSVPPEQQRFFDPVNVAALDLLCTSLPIEKIVVSSSWRRGRTLGELQEMLVDNGLKRADLIADKTPIHGFEYDGRASEIRAWCREHRPARILVLDDMELSSLPGEQFYRVDSATGLTEAMVQSLILLFEPV